MTQVKLLVSEEKLNKIRELYSNVQRNDEFEFLFYTSKIDHSGYINMVNYINLVNYIKSLANEGKYKLVGPVKTLDVGYNRNDGTTFRMTILGKDNIANFLRRGN